MEKTTRTSRSLSLTVSWTVKIVTYLALLLIFSSIAYADQVTIDESISILSSNTEYEGDDVIIDGVTVTIDGTHNFNSLQLVNGAVLTHSVETTSIPYLQIATTLTIDGSSSIDVSAKGQLPSAEVCVNCGGSYGGYGGIYGNGTTNEPYGSYIEPFGFGMGSRSGSSEIRGGGSIKIFANVLELSGKIIANGEAVPCDISGSGGSIWLNTDVLRGDVDGVARIQANSYSECAPYYSPGSGGRVAVYYGALENFDLNTQVSANSQSSYGQAGAPGTVYTHNKTLDSGKLRIHDGNVSSGYTNAVAVITGTYTHPVSIKSKLVNIEGSYQKLTIEEGSAVTQIGVVTAEQLTISNSSSWDQNGYELTAGIDITVLVTDDGAGHTHTFQLDSSTQQSLKTSPGVANAVSLVTSTENDHTHTVTVWWDESQQKFIYSIADDHGHGIDVSGAELDVDAYTARILSDKPVAYWKMDETSGTSAVDSSGSGYDGIYTGIVGLGSEVMTGSGSRTAVAFSGNGYVSGEGSPAGADDADALTVEAWVVLDDTSQVMLIYDQRAQTGGNSNVSLQYRGGDTGKFRFDKYPPSDGWMESTTIPQAGRLYHVVYTEQGSTRSLYVNGVLEAQDQTAETYTGQSNSLWAIGARAGDGELGWHGLIDEVEIYNFVLTAEQIQQHYNLGLKEHYGWWDGAWKNRQSLLLSSAESETIEQYQMRYVINHQTGMNSDFSDLRFIDQNGNKLSYWVERKTDNVSATVWIKFPRVVASADQVFYLYYGNFAALSESSGVDTFDFFDDFDSFNSVWSTTSKLNYEIPFSLNGENVAKLASSDGVNWAELQYKSAPSLQNGQAYSFDFYKAVDSWFHPGFINTANDMNGSRWGIRENNGPLLVTKVFDGGGLINEPILISSPKENTWYTGTIYVDDTDGFYLEVVERDTPSVIAAARETGFIKGEKWWPRIAKNKSTANYIDKFRVYKLPRTGVTVSQKGRETLTDLIYIDVTIAMTDDGAGHGHDFVFDAEIQRTLKLNLGVANAVSLTSSSVNDHAHMITVWWDASQQKFIYSIADDHGHGIDGAGSELVVDAYTKQVLVDKPIGYWKLNETTGTTALDSSGSGYSGTYKNGPILNVTGLSSLGGAAEFDGTDDYVEISPSFPQLADNFTFEAWARVDTFDGWRTFIGRDHSNPVNSNNGYCLHKSDVTEVLPSGHRTEEHAMMHLRWEATDTWVEDDGPVNLNEWGHYVVTYDGSSVKFYSNGRLTHEELITEQLEKQTGPLFLAVCASDGGVNASTYHDGALSNVAIYKNALTEEQVRHHTYLGRYSAVPQDRTITITDDGAGHAHDFVLGSETQQILQLSPGVKNAIELAASESNGHAHQISVWWDATEQKFIYKIADDHGHGIDGVGTELNVDVYTAQVLADKPIGYWKLNETTGATALDSSGSGYSGTYMNGPTLNVAGLSQLGNAAEFDGTDDYVEVPSSFPQLTNKFTLEAWARVDSNDGLLTFAGRDKLDPEELWSAYGIAKANSTDVFTSGHRTNNHIYMQFGTEDIHYFVEGDRPINIGEWCHYVVTYDGSEAKFYSNGRLTDTVSAQGPLVAQYGPLVLGASTDGTVKNHYNGALSNIAIYTDALTAEQIRNHTYLGHYGTLPQDTTITITDEGAGHTHDLILDSDTQQILQLSPGVANAVTLTTSIVDDHAHTVTVWWDATEQQFYYLIADDHGHGIDGIGSERIEDTYTTRILLDKPIAYWKFDEAGWNGTANEIIDSSGNGNNGAAINATTTPGLLGQAADLSATGIDDYLTMNPAALSGLANFTVSGWVKASTYGFMLSAANTSRHNELLLHPDTSRADVDVNNLLYIRNYSIGPFARSNIDHDVWHYVVWTRAADTHCLYIDGALHDRCITMGPTDPINVSTGGLIIGQEQDAVGGDFDAEQSWRGLLDEYAIFDYALTAEQIQQHYEASNMGWGNILGIEDISPQPDAHLATSLSSINLRFSLPIEVSSLQPEDIVITGPQSPIDFTIEAVDERTFTLNFTTPIDTDGDYTIAIGPNIVSSGGSSMDQDRDGIEGEDSDDLFTSSFAIDQADPSVPTVTSHVLVPEVNYSNQYVVTITGTRESNTSLWINGSKVLGIGSDPWSVNRSLSQGDNTVTLRSQDQAGNISPAVELRFNVDSVAPQVGGVVPSNGSYHNQAIEIISVGYTETGTGIDLGSSSLVLQRNGVVVGGSAADDGAGHITYTPDTDLLDGSYQFSVQLHDKAGNTSSSYNYTFVLDRVPPAAPGVDALPAATTVNQHTLSGTKEAYSAIIINDTQYVGNTASESWSTTVSLSEGENSFQVKARDRSGNVGLATAASIVYDNVSPGAVTTLVGNGEGDGTHIQLNWSGYNEVANGNDIKRYDIYLSTAMFSDVSGMNAHANVSSGTYQYQLEGLTRGTIYYIAVVAVDQNDNALTTVTPIEVTATDTVAPENPAGISVTDSQSTSLSVSWQVSADSAGDLAGYRLYVDQADALALDKDILSHQLTDLDPATAYSLRISAIDSSGNESSGKSVTGVTLMPNPGGVSATEGDSAVDLAWSLVSPQSQVSSYAVYYSESAFSSVEGMTPSTTVGANVATARIAGLTNGTTYYFAVTTINSSGGETKAVTSVSAMPDIDDDGPELTELKIAGTSVTEGYELTQSGNFSVTAKDPAGVALVELLIDEEVISTDSDDSNDIQLPWDIAATTDGAHVIKIKARDNLGNESELTRNVTVAMPPPAAPTITSPSNGVTTNQEQVQVKGKAEADVEVQLLLEGAEVGDPVQSASDGSFTFVADLAEGDNHISAVASNRGGAGNPSSSVTVTLDSSIPPAPYGLAGNAGEHGVISLTWTPVVDSTVKGYDLYRSDAAFDDIDNADKINTALLTAGRFDDLPAADGTYYYRVVSRNELGTASAPSLAVSVVSDRTQPRAEQIEYQPQGAYDPETGRIAPGRVNVEVTVNEALLTTPFLSMTVDGGVPISIALEKQSDLIYTGHFDLTASSKSGTAYAVFSARDLVGNRGTGIDQGKTVIFDTDGPAVTVLNILPSSPVKNDSSQPQQVRVTLTLDQAVKAGSTPDLGYLLGNSTDDIAVDSLIQTGELTWQADFTLPDTAGEEPESLRFVFSALDDLDNQGTEIQAPNEFQVYQGDLPPLAAPTGLSANALSGGRIDLGWDAVEDAAEYQLLRQAPGETGLTAYQRISGLTYTDTDTVDGEYQYAIASVRQENGQESVSDHSTPVTVTADALVPEAPQGLSLELVGAGIQALWQEVAPVNGETLSYNIYRSNDPQMDSVEGLTPLQTNIVPNKDGVLGYIDRHPNRNEAAYVVTAVDGAGNESLPSESVYLNIDLLPVATLEVSLSQDSYPQISWSHTGSTIAGYNIYLGQGTGGMKLNSTLFTGTSYADSGYNGGERYYTVTAVDINEKESVGRTIYLPDIELALDSDAQLARGIMNRLQFQLHNAGSADVSGMQLQVDLDGHLHRSSDFSLTSGAERTQPMVIGGFDDLPDQITADVLLRIDAATGEVVKLNSQEIFAVGEDTPALSVQAQDMVRGTAAQIRFEFANASDVEVELIAARNSGNQASDEIRILLEDTDGNVLSVVPYQQATGDGIITLSNKKSVARVAAGATFTSGWIDLPVPENAPDDVVVRVVIDHQHYQVGEVEHVSIGGVEATQQATLTQTAYIADIQSISPQNSYGEEPIVISGRALDRTDQTPVPDTKVKLVISSNGFEREREVTTDTDGNYSYSFTPLSGEAGVYKVSAIHPDMLTRPEQGQFIISKVSISPQTLNLYLPYNVPKTFNVITATAASGTQASNLRMVHIPGDGESGLPEGISITLPDPQNLGSGQKIKLPFTLSADNNAPAQGSLTFHVRSDERGSEPLAVITLNYKFSEAKPALYFSPNYLETGVAHNGYTPESITLQNKGLAPMNDVKVQLLNPDGSAAPTWIHLTSSATIGTLAVGASSAVNLTLSPSDSVAEGVHEFMLRVSSSNHPVRDINIFASVTQDGIGGMFFKVSDIYTFTNDANGQQIEGLSGARITVQNEAVLSVQETMTTDSKGEVIFSDLPAGYYRFRASASNHQDLMGRFTIKPGITGAQNIFLEYDLVTVEWSVTETTIQDVYEITLHATFETDVPAAVVVLEPSSTQLPDMEPGEVFQGELRITNYGLIRAENFTFTLPGEDAYYRYEFPQGLPETLEAKESLTIPYRVTMLQSTESDGSGAGANCSGYSGYMRAKYEFVCANGVWSRRTIGHTWVRPYHGAACGGGSGTNTSWTGGGNGGGYGGGSYGGVSYGSMPGAVCPAPCPSGTCSAGGGNNGSGQ